MRFKNTAKKSSFFMLISLFATDYIRLVSKEQTKEAAFCYRKDEKIIILKGKACKISKFGIPN
ncbi:MAG: hypothetical protein J6V63_08530 [Spirochaetaceae bacterium]|nr:hypothetical protein [Spirochaetaceae bacterium]